MKKIILIILIIALVMSCQPEPDLPAVYTATGTPDDPIEPPESPKLPVLLALYDNSNLYYYDGETIQFNAMGQIAYGKNRILSVNDIIYTFDEFGEVITSEYLSHTPDRILIDGSDIWQFVNIEPAEANALGGGYKYYTLVIKNNVELFPWYTYQFFTDSADITPTGKIILQDGAGHFLNLTDSGVPYKLQDGLYIEDVNFDSRIAVMNGVNIAFSDNYFYSSRWQKLGDIWISSKGYEFDGLALTKNANDLQNYIPLSLWPAGENNEYCYWFDSTTGDLYRYIQNIDRLDLVGLLFIGSGDFGTGNMLAPAIKPIWIAGIMYFHDSGSIKTYNPQTGEVNIFTTDMEVWEW